MNDYYLEKSNNPKKKYMVSYINQNTGKVNTIKFGQAGASDMTQHKNEQTKMNYIKRHEKNEDWTDLTKAGTWSRFILWNKSTLKASIQDMEKRFNIKIWFIE
jgi:hypothetical protein